jgi:ribosomal 50S subunit-recycling heat shock protein
MMKYHLLPALLLVFSISVSGPAPAQEPGSVKTENKSAKPFRILTSGRKITIQAKKNIKTVIVWTSGGHRIIEQKDINATSYSFEITIQEKIFFVRVDMEDDKMYTQKIGVQ